MTAEIADVIAGEYMRPQARERVIALLRAVPSSPADRRRLYAQWARAVGVPVALNDLDLVAIPAVTLRGVT